LLRRKLFPCSN